MSKFRLSEWNVKCKKASPHHIWWNIFHRWMGNRCRTQMDSNCAFSGWWLNWHGCAEFDTLTLRAIHFFVRFYANEKKNWLYYICSIEYCRWHIVHLFSTLNRIEWQKGASRANNTQKVIQLCITVIKRRPKKRQTFTSNTIK